MFRLLSFGQTNQLTRSFDYWTTFDHSNTRLVKHSDPHCVTDYNLCLDLCVQLSKYCFLHLSLFDLWVLFYFVLSDVVVLNLICTPWWAGPVKVASSAMSLQSVGPISADALAIFFLRVVLRRLLAFAGRKSGHFCLDFKCFMTKWWPFVWIPNGWASGFQIPFKIQTTCKPTIFDHSKSRLVRISDPHCIILHL